MFGAVRSLTIVGAAAAALVTAGAVAQALPEPTELRLRAEERAGSWRAYRELLADPDRDVRHAAFALMVESDHLPLRELAYEAGLTSEDPLLRGLALRHRVLEREAIVLEPRAGDALPVTVLFRSKDLLSGNFLPRCGRGGPNCHGRVEGESVVFAHDGCVGRLELENGSRLAGTYRCPRDEPREVFVRLR